MIFMYSGSTYGQSYFFEFIPGWRAVHGFEQDDQNYSVVGLISDSPGEYHLRINNFPIQDRY